jgi:hypothetical protein
MRSIVGQEVFLSKTTIAITKIVILIKLRINHAGIINLVVIDAFVVMLISERARFASLPSWVSANIIFGSADEAGIEILVVVEDLADVRLVQTGSC